MPVTVEHDGAGQSDGTTSSSRPSTATRGAGRRAPAAELWRQRRRGRTSRTATRLMLAERRRVRRRTTTASGWSGASTGRTIWTFEPAEGVTSWTTDRRRSAAAGPVVTVTATDRRLEVRRLGRRHGRDPGRCRGGPSRGRQRRLHRSSSARRRQALRDHRGRRPADGDRLRPGHPAADSWHHASSSHPRRLRSTAVRCSASATAWARSTPATRRPARSRWQQRRLGLRRPDARRPADRRPAPTSGGWHGAARRPRPAARSSSCDRGDADVDEITGTRAHRGLARRRRPADCRDQPARPRTGEVVAAGHARPRSTTTAASWRRHRLACVRPATASWSSADVG